MRIVQRMYFERHMQIHAPKAAALMADLSAA